MGVAVRAGVLVVWLGLTLACGGWVPDIDVARGVHAVHPADFIFPPPERGELETVATMPMMGRDNTTLTYVLASTDAEAALDRYGNLLQDKGLKVNRTEGFSPSVTASSDTGALYTAALGVGNTDTEARLTLTASVPSGE